MNLRNTTESYGLVSRVNHWLMAILIVGLFVVGLYMTSLGYYDALYHTLPWWHKSIGLCVFLLLILRFMWKMLNPQPHSLATHSAFEKKAASLTHKSFYLLISLIIVSGYFISTAKGKGVSFFDWFEIPALITPITEQADKAGLVHLWLAYLLAAFVTAHAAGALKHHFIDKDETLKRMTRGNTK